MVVGHSKVVGMASGIRTVKLACISCGASLEIANDVEQIACAHCGTPQRLERSGGAIFLKGITDTLSQVKQGTDKTAAELAIVRLTK